VIIDAQIHRPAPALPWVELGEGSQHINEDAELALAAMDAVGVDMAIVHGDYAFCEAAHARYPTRFRGIVQFSDPFGMKNVQDEIAAVRGRPGLLGFRMAPAAPRAGPNLLPALQNGQLDKFFAAAQANDVPVLLFVPGGLSHIHRIARSFPNLTLIIDHLGLPPPPWVPLKPNLLDGIPELLQLAAYPNVALKFTGVPALSMEAFPFQDLWGRGLIDVIETFGPERLLWGSDFTRVKQHHTYSDELRFLLDTDRLSANDKETMLFRSTQHWLRIPGIDTDEASLSAGGSPAHSYPSNGG